MPLQDGKALAERNNVLDKLLPIFDFVPGERSPPPAPKHATATSSKPKLGKALFPARKLHGTCNSDPPSSRLSNHAEAKNYHQPSSLARVLGCYRIHLDYILRADRPTVHREVVEDNLESRSNQINEDQTPDNATVISESIVDDQDMATLSQYSFSSRKRKRSVDHASLQDHRHQLWADALLDYFMLLESEDRFPAPPEPPPNIDLDRPIDDQGHSAMHWAAAMGDVDIVKDLISRGASIDCVSGNHETPIMRAVMFTNNFDKKTMPKLITLLSSSVTRTDFFGSTVFHHVAATTSSRSKYLPARYYIDCIINKLSESWSVNDIAMLLNAQDHNGDTAIMIAARNGARKCVRSLLGRNAAVDIPNCTGETAEELIRVLNNRRHERLRQTSSSPFRPDSHQVESGSIGTLFNGFHAHNPHYCSEAATTLKRIILAVFSERVERLTVAYESEIAEKERECAEVESVIRKRQAELDTIQKQSTALEADREAESCDVAQGVELEDAVAASRGLIELDQRTELGRLLEGWEARSHRDLRQPLGRGTSGEEGNRLMAAIFSARTERKHLASDIAWAESAAGTGSRQVEYKRLLTGALGVREAEIEGMLRDILDELEVDRS